ncbi:hypothetical protein CKAH01_07000 [Colletotrichum kahawae]|uniref:Uncharacterized protein n=1 Tax=Colletotrichum kahawae TaxID=34407 RepID=A0AAD9Y5G5_COLKA|nr:hypothetical protein CKAH01_07000 [Colletotrichum kahawae]
MIDHTKSAPLPRTVLAIQFISFSQKYPCDTQHVVELAAPQLGWGGLFLPTSSSAKLKHCFFIIPAPPSGFSTVPKSARPHFLLSPELAQKISLPEHLRQPVPSSMSVSLHQKYNNRAPAITLLSGPTMRVRKEKGGLQVGTGTNKSKSSNRESDLSVTPACATNGQDSVWALGGVWRGYQLSPFPRGRTIATTIASPSEKKGKPLTIDI